MKGLVTYGYSLRQIGLHWVVFLLVAYQWFTGDDMADLFEAAHGGPAAAVNPGWATVHVVVRVAVLLLMVWRLGLRHTEWLPAIQAGVVQPMRLIQGFSTLSLPEVLVIFLKPPCLESHKVTKRSIISRSSGLTKLPNSLDSRVTAH